MNKLPPIPAEAVAFNCIDFGGYTPRGYDPSRISGRMVGMDIANLQSEGWANNPGQSGSSLILYDKNNTILGRIHVPSRGLYPNGVDLKFVSDKKLT